MKVFVTGATGFVGSHIARVFLAAGHEVRILRRQNSKQDAIADLDVEHCIGNLNDPDQMTEFLTGVDWVIHTAAVSDYWRTGKATIYHVNVDGTQSLLQASERAGIQRFIFTSSAAAIGYQPRIVTEGNHFNLDPNLSPYGHSKFLAEAAVYQAIQRGLDAVILNPAIIMGPGDLNIISGSLVLEVAKGMVPVMPNVGGTTFIDVRDVAQAHLAAAEKGRTGERYLLGAVNMTHKAMLRLIAGVTHSPVPKLPAPPVPVAAAVVDFGRWLGLELPADGNQIRLSGRDWYFDCGKAWRELHEPEIEIQQSIGDTYEWYREHGYL